MKKTSYKRVQATQKSILSDPRVDDLHKEDKWWLSLKPGFVNVQTGTTCDSAPTLRDIADTLNDDVMTQQEYDEHNAEMHRKYFSS